MTADPKLTYGLGVYLNLWGEEATAIQYGAGGAIAALTLYGCNFAQLPGGLIGAAIKLACAAGGAAAAIEFLQALINGQITYQPGVCYQTRLVPPNGQFAPVGPENCA